ncbi:MAG: NAD(P)H-binding protein [Verrucomicrobiota bacterium]
MVNSLGAAAIAKKKEIDQVERMKTMTRFQPAQDTNTVTAPFLVIGGSGKTGRRVVERLQALGHDVRGASRSSSPSFDWHHDANWNEVLAGVKALYVTYHPDLSVPGASDHIRALLAVAKAQGVERIVLLSGRGEEEAQLCERLVLNSSIPATVVRCGWFNQNFSESFFRDLLMSGTLAVPNAHVGEGYVDADDIADVATAALTQDGHEGQIYQLTGPELLTFRDIAAIFQEITGREMNVVDVSREEFVEGLEAAQLPEGLVQLVDYLFNEVLDGRNASLGDGVQRALGRPPRDFRSFLEKAHLSGTFA